MNNFVQDSVENFNQSLDMQNLNQHFIQSIQALGFSSFTHYGIRMPQMSASESPAQTNYNPKWVNRYIEQEYHLIDPVLAKGLKSNLPFTWGGLSKKTSKFMSEAIEFNHSVGMTIPIHSQLGAFALLSVCTEQDQADLDKLLYEKLPILHFVAHQYHQNIIKLTATKEPPIVLLSPREREVLKWTAQGKTAWEISEILDIATSTVHQYIQNAGKKMGVSNKSHAIAKAIVSGIITL